MSTPTPQINWTADKAWVGAIASAILAGLSALAVAMGDDRITSAEMVTIIIAMLTSSGVTGTAVYQKGNRPR